MTSNAIAARSWRENAFSGTVAKKETRIAAIRAATAKNCFRASVLCAKYPKATAEAKTLSVRRTIMKSPVRRTVRSFERSKAKNVAGRPRTEKNASEFGLPKVQNARVFPHSGKTTRSKTGSNPTDWASAYGKFETTNPNANARTASIRNRFEEIAIPQKNAARPTKTETEYARPRTTSSAGWSP